MRRSFPRSSRLIPRSEARNCRRRWRRPPREEVSVLIHIQGPRWVQSPLRRHIEPVTESFIRNVDVRDPAQGLHLYRSERRLSDVYRRGVDSRVSYLAGREAVRPVAHGSVGWWWRDHRDQYRNRAGSQVDVRRMHTALLGCQVYSWRCHHACREALDRQVEVVRRCVRRRRSGDG
jgi:hypothetical protein